MKRLLTIIVVLLFLFSSALAQMKIEGDVTGEDGSPCSDIIVRMFSGNRILAFTKSDKEGHFILKKDSIPYPIRLSFTSPVFAEKNIELSENPLSPLKISLTKEAYQLKEVIVHAPATRVKGDTISYSVSAFSNAADRNIEDVIKKLPGITVDDYGTISYEGETINNFYIEGLNLMGNRYAVATQNIRPDDVASVDIYQRHQHKKVLKNVVDSQKAALNLKLKKGSMLRPVGYLEGGIGAGDNLLWKGGFYGMLISPENQTILSAKANNAGNVYANFQRTGNYGVADSFFQRMPFGVPSIEMSRYMDNKSTSASANTIFKLSDESTFTINTSYANENDSYRGSERREYLEAGNSPIAISQNVNNRLRYHSLSGGLKYEDNTNTRYLLENLKFYGRFDDNSYGIETPSENVSQRQKDHHFMVNNNFNYIIKKSAHVFDIKSETSLINSPLNYMIASDLQSDVVKRNQSIRGLSFRNMEETGINFMFGSRLTTGTTVKFNINYDSFNSLGITNSGGDEANDLTGYRITLSANPYIKYKFKGVAATLTVPLSFYNLDYKNRIEGNTNRFHRPYAGVNLSLFRRIRTSDVEMSLGRRHNIGDFKDFILNPIFTTYRNSTIPGTGLLNISHSDYLKVSGNYRDHPREFYILASAGLSRGTSNVMSVSEISADSDAGSSVRKENKRDNISFMAAVNKNVRPWEASFSISATIMSQRYNTIRNSVNLSSRNDIYMFTFKSEKTLFDEVLIANLDVAYTFSKQKFSANIPSKNLDDLTLRGRLSLFPVKWFELYGMADYGRSKLEVGNYKSNIFVDCGANMKFRKFEVNIAGRNLANKRTYSYRIYSSLDYINYSYELRPIEGVLSLKYSF